MNFNEEQFLEAIKLWAEWNERINVVSRKDIDQLYPHHVLHSLAIAEYLGRQGETPESLKGARFLDVGCGGGFPGIPLAMVYPEAEFTLCDSIGKKITVAKAVAEGVGLKNVRFANARAESLPDKYDWVVSRAVTALDNFYPWVKGKFGRGILYLKGGDVCSEISAMCSKCRVNPASVGVWPISDWLDDDYFAEKFVIHVRK